jgi:hypothetical protein
MEDRAWDQANIERMRQKELRVLRTFPSLWLKNARGTFVRVPVRNAVGQRHAAVGASVSCTRLAACVRVVPAMCMSFTPSIAVPCANSISTPTCPIWLRREAITLIASFPWQCVWWSRTDCRIDSHPGTSGAIIVFLFLTPRSKTGSRLRGKKAEQHEDVYLDWALSDFSGYIAADELYDGPFCVLSVVDSRRQRRLLFEVLDHVPTHADIERFFRRLQNALAVRGPAVRGITTDASTLYPQPIAAVFGDIPHQICEFHTLKDLTKVVLGVVAKLRKQLAAQAPPLPRGRPTPATRRRHRRAQALRQRVSELFEHRHLFVRHGLTVCQHKTLQQLIRGQAQLRALREIMDEVYRLFDRRCRTDTALEKLRRLRRRVQRFKSLGKSLDKLKSPNLEKALTFLDDNLLPATSNAVERGNRRHRKMQKSIYRVRTKQNTQGRMAMDLQREQQAPGRHSTVACLHQARNAA